MVQRVQSLRSSVKNARPAAGAREPGEIFLNFPDLQLGVIDAAKVPKDLIAVRFFSATTNYAAGDFVIEAGVAYRANTAIVAGAFNASQWDTISTAVDLDSKEDTILPGTTAQYWRGDKSWQALNKAAVGLDQVDNTSDANKPVSIAQATADASKVTKAGDTMTGHLGLPASPGPSQAVRRDYVDVADGVLQSNINLKADLNSPAFTGNPTAPTPTAGDADTSIATTAYVTSAVTAATGGFLGDAPNDGQSYGRKNLGWVDVTEEAPSDDISYGRKNGAWIPSVGGAVISDTPPPGPLTPGQLWWESDTGDTYIWVDDGTSQQWVQQNIQPGTPAMPSPGATAQARNRIVNGAMQYAQEYGATGSPSLAWYPADQWALSGVTTGAISTQWSPIVTPNGSKNRIRIAVTTADTSLAAGEYLQLYQPIEGGRVADFRYGSASARQSILRFGFKGPAGTYSASLINGTANRSYVANFTISAGQAGTDTEQVFAIPGDTTGTWATDTGYGIGVRIVLAAGTTFQGATGWQVGNVLGTSANTNGLASAINEFFVGDVGLYLDPDATGLPPKWQMPDEAEELRACQRYWQSVPANGFRFSGNVTSGTNYYAGMLMPVSMRTASPALTGVNSTAAYFPATAGTFVASGFNAISELRLANATSNGGYFASNVIANARM